MPDVFDEKTRSYIMSRVRTKNTKPELIVRSLLHSNGYRFRLHRSDLPGTPDIVLPKYRSVIFVNGCFWHHHENCTRAMLPKSNNDYWNSKLDQNIKRDQRNYESLAELGWGVLVIWECEMSDTDKLLLKLANFLLQRSV